MKLNVTCLAAFFSVFACAGHMDAQASQKKQFPKSTKMMRYAQVQNDERDVFESDDEDVEQNQKTGKAKFKKHTYVRIQQLPFLGMAAVSDDGVLDIEVMQAINKNFHIGPTGVFHYGMQGDTKMKSMNLGVRADFILPNFGNLNEVYVSSAFMLGKYSSSTKRVEQEWQETNGTGEYVDVTTCDYKSEGYHRVGAFVLGKIWRLSESTHLTTGLGVVKSKTFNGTTKSSGTCSDKSITESEGTSLPWVDFGVGFNI
jgi:hypothetical protein